MYLFSSELDLIEWFLNNGVNINHTHNGIDALHLTCKRKHINCSLLLALDFSHLQIIVDSGNLELLKAIHRNKPNCSFESATEGSLLHVAAANNQIEIAQHLLHWGVSVDRQNSTGSTALHKAASNGYTEFCDLLVKHGAKMNIKQTDGWTALHLAAHNNHLKTVNFLLEKNVCVDSLTHKKKTPLYLACKRKAGADPNIADSKGRSSLEVARNKHHDEIAVLLKQHNAEDTPPRSIDNTFLMMTLVALVDRVEKMEQEIQELKNEGPHEY